MADFHVWSGGDNTDGLTWAKAKTTIQSGLDLVSAKDDRVHIAKETFIRSSTTIPKQFVQRIIGGYDITQIPSKTDFSTTSREGLTIMKGVSFSTPNIIMQTDTANVARTGSEFYLIIEGIHYIGIDAGAGNKTDMGFRHSWRDVAGEPKNRIKFINCGFSETDNAFKIRPLFSDAEVHCENCTFNNLSRISEDDVTGHRITIETMDSCVMNNILMETFPAFNPLIISLNNSIIFASGFTTSIVSGNNNLDVDPKLVDATNNNIALKLSSPGIDHGNTGFAFSNEPAPNGGRINAGAFGNLTSATQSPSLLFVSSFGSNTSPYDSISKAATLTQTAIDFYRLNLVSAILSIDSRQDHSSSDLYAGVPLGGFLKVKPYFTATRPKVGKFEIAGGAPTALELTLESLELKENTNAVIDMTNQSGELVLNNVILRSLTNTIKGIEIATTALKVTVNNLLIDMPLAATGINYTSSDVNSVINFGNIIIDSAAGTGIIVNSAGKIIINSNILDCNIGLLESAAGEIVSKFNMFIIVTTKYSGNVTDKTGDLDITNPHFKDAANGDFRLTRVSPMVGKADPVLPTLNGPGGR